LITAIKLLFYRFSLENMDLSYGDLQTDLKMNGRAPIKKTVHSFSWQDLAPEL
jgi:hypothetical protein